ncbi:MAG: hypothetical protein JRG91_15570, partial [Deltaproteobacteria bacterium]|nr:hypothetical protein [Deltaproteobacteria bacterium]
AMETGIDQSWRIDFTLHVANNVFSAMTGSALEIEASEVAEASELVSNLFWQDGSTLTVRWGTSHTIGSSSDFSSLTGGTVAGNEVGDPLFADDGAGDFVPGSGSPAVDMGDASIVEAVCADFTSRYGLDIQVDLDGVARPQGAGWDAGPHEQ